MIKIAFRIQALKRIDTFWVFRQRTTPVLLPKPNTLILYALLLVEDKRSLDRPNEDGCLWDMMIWKSRREVSLLIFRHFLTIKMKENQPGTLKFGSNCRAQNMYREFFFVASKFDDPWAYHYIIFCGDGVSSPKTQIGQTFFHKKEST